MQLDEPIRNIVTYRVSKPLTENEKKCLQLVRQMKQATEGVIARSTYIHRGNVRRTMASLYVKGYVVKVTDTNPLQWSPVIGARY